MFRRLCRRTYRREIAMRRLAVVGTALMIGAGIVGASPAQGQPVPTVPPMSCSPSLATVCGLVGRQIQHVQEELGRVPGYVEQIEDIVIPIYDRVTYTVRCIVTQECP